MSHSATSALSALTATADIPTVPNELTPGARFAIIGEAPGEDEVQEQRPFVGASGRLLWSLASQAGIARHNCSVLNVCQHWPEGNDIAQFHWDGAQLTEGRRQLREQLLTLKPNIVICLGATALRAATGEQRSISDWACSLFWSDEWQCKCIAAPHPAAIFRSYPDRVYLRVALRRAAEHSKTRELNLPPLQIEFLAKSADIGQFRQKVKQWRAAKAPISLDIEGGIRTMSCISFADSPNYAYVVPFTHPDGTSYWSVEDEAEIWTYMVALLGDPQVPKILQNYLYDAFVLRYAYHTPIRGLRDDTMLKHWELFCELEKSLAAQAQLYTLRPYYKSGRSTTGMQLWSYCGTDSAVTWEANAEQSKHLSTMSSSEWHYRFNMALLPAFLYMQLRGIRYDAEGGRKALAELNRIIYARQHALNLHVGRSLHTFTIPQLVQLVWDKCCYKRTPVLFLDDILLKPRAEYSVSIYRIHSLIKQFNDTGSLEPHEFGELENLLDYGPNVDSPPQMKELLYETWKHPRQYKKVKGYRTGTLTCDALAMLNIFIKTRDVRVLEVLKLRAYIDRRTSLELKCDEDGRVRCSYIVVGSETGRIACKTSVTGSGTNLQTIPSRFRWIFKADPGYHFFYKDLSGADAWTVACHLAALGDPTMLDDLRAGLKPAKIIALMRKHGPSINRLSRAELKELSKTIRKDDWMYMGGKRVGHGYNYGMQVETMSDQLLKDSFKYGGDDVEPDDILYISPDECRVLSGYYVMRYPGIMVWHRKCKRDLLETGMLVSAGGHVRRFLNRRDDIHTFMAYLADGPQNNTTFGTNRALLTLWRDPENRNSDNSLIIQPLHQVHDALCGQFPIDRTEWAVAKIQSYFNKPLTIAGTTVTIPSEGGYGPSWGECNNPL